MDYPFGKIREIRKTRQRDSEIKLNKEKHVLAQADKELASTEQKLEQYREQRRQKEQSLSDAIIRKPVSLKEFEHFQLEIDYMREAENNHMGQVRKAKEEKKKAAQKVDEALRVYYLRNREKLKIEEHHTQWSKIASLEEARKAENDMDEIGQLIDPHVKQNQ